MTRYNVTDILEGIRQNDIEIMQYVYKAFYPYVKYFIIRNNGAEDDAQDIFQEAIVIIYKKLKNGELEINCAFKTYLYSVCRLLWLKQLEKNKKRNEQTIENEDAVELSESFSETSDEVERYRLYQEYFSKLGKDCQKVLSMSLSKVPLKEIADIMGYKSEKYAKKKKYQCKETLISEIKNDPQYKELLIK